MIGNLQWPVRATTSYSASPIDQTMIEQSNHYRVSQLVQALTFWIARDPRLPNIEARFRASSLVARQRKCLGF